MEKIHKLLEKDGHTVSFSEWGNPEGPAIIFFHGGPGSKSKPKHAELFDLEKYCVILFDQRGCGKSMPQGKLENNTTEDILRDAERIREQLGIERWYVSGGSWGATLALLYAQGHSEKTMGLILYSIFFADRESTDWSFKGIKGTAQFVPDVLEKRTKFLEKYNTTPKEASKTLSELLEGNDLEQQKEIVAGVANWEDNLYSPIAKISYISPEDVEEGDIASVKVYLHYEKNEWFVEDDQIMNGIDKIKNIPTIIVHGRYDILCPIMKAFILNKALKNSEMIIASSSGHSFSAEGDEIRRLAFDRFLIQQNQIKRN